MISRPNHWGLDNEEEYHSLAIRAKDRAEREVYERIVELYVEIAEKLEALIDGRPCGPPSSWTSRSVIQNRRIF